MSNMPQRLGAMLSFYDQVRAIHNAMENGSLKQIPYFLDHLKSVIADYEEYTKEDEA